MRNYEGFFILQRDISNGFLLKTNELKFSSLFADRKDIKLTKIVS
jgi:hypothetical protein